jgi:hypothetical protein
VSACALSAIEEIVGSKNIGMEIDEARHYCDITCSDLPMRSLTRTCAADTLHLPLLPTRKSVSRANAYFSTTIPSLLYH